MAAPKPKPTSFEVDAAGVALAGEEVGEGPPVLLMHGLTATRRYVVHGSLALPRRGHRVISYDARGHGESAPAPAGGAYSYEELRVDLSAVLAQRCPGERPVLAGHSMGAHTAVSLALGAPERLAGAVLICPASLGTPLPEEALAEWDRLAEGLEREGVEGFLAVYATDLDPKWRETLLRMTRERLSGHRHLQAVAAALREVPRSAPFEGLSELEFLDLPALVVASHDEADPGHPFAAAEAWAERMPNARLVSEEPGSSPLAWQGGRLSRLIADFCREPPVTARSR